MKFQVSNTKLKRIAVFLVLLYAIGTRSIIARYVFGTRVQLLAFYIITYFLLFWGLFTAFTFIKEGPHIYAPKKFFSVLLISLVIIIGLFVTNDTYTLLYYGLALLLPFSVIINDSGKYSGAKAFTIVGIIATIGSLLNYIFPTIYTAIIPYFFSGYSLHSLQWLIGERTFFPGFFSQVNYTAFFIGLAIGSLFIFRKYCFSRSWGFWLLFLAFGMLLTGKRGAFVYVIVAFVFVYFLEGEGREKFKRVISIAAILISAYILLYIVAHVSSIPSIERIFDAVNDFLLNGTPEDVGREQLHQQAWTYFYQHPVFGIGWDNFKEVFTARGTHVHCIYLQLLCETGIVGAVIFYCFFTFSLISTIYSFYRYRNENAAIGMWLEFSIFIQVYFLLFGITENPIYDVEEMILYMYAIGLSNITVAIQPSMVTE